MKEEEETSKRKFICLMRTLTTCLQKDSSHRRQIYNSLNREDKKRLFESLHDEEQMLRTTAINFLCYLLHKNPIITEDKYLLGGLVPYHFSHNQLKEVITIINRVKYKPNTLCWAVELKTYKEKYFIYGADITIDPNLYLVGVFGDRKL